MTAQAPQPSPVNQSDVQPRRMGFQYDDSVPRYWFAGDQFKTLVLTALSCTFPEGERFFVRSVRRYQDGIEDEELAQRVKGFIGQEAHHGNEHETFNALMERNGIPANKVEAFVHEGLKWQESRMSPERALAKTCALEHFTAILAEAILGNEEIIEGMDEQMVPLWLWHAVEESEHKSVAFDVYQDQVGSYWLRVGEMARTTVEFLSFTAFHYLQLRWDMDDDTDWRSVARGFNWLLGRPGWLRRLGSAYRAYYRPGFHPSERDGSALRRKGLDKLADMLNWPELRVHND